MSLIILNGSPRNKKSNSGILIRHFLAGYNTVNPEEVPVFHLASSKEREAAATAFSQASHCLLVFPLYTDAMPSIVKEWMELVYLGTKGNGQKFGFIVQSGFSEVIHSLAVERYLEKFCARMACSYTGTLIKAGVEGIQIMPPSMTKKLFHQFEELGKYYARHSAFEPAIMKAFRKPIKMPLIKRFLYPLIPSTLKNFYWNSHLKKYKAWEKRFDQPYLE